MKKLSAFIFLYTVLAFSLYPPVISASTSKNQYHVLFVNGTVKLAKTNKLLKVGDSITNSDNLSFQSKGAFVDVLNLERGRISLRPDPKIPKKSNELLYIVKSIVTPGQFSMSTRGGVINNVQDLRKILLENPFLLLNEEAVVKINPVAFPMNEDTFFFVSYEINGEKINKQLDFEDDKLKFSFSKIFTVDGKPVKAKKRGKFDLVYYNTKSEELTNVGNVEYFVPDYMQVKKQAGLLVKLLRNSGKDKKQIMSMLSSFLIDRYGYVTDHDLKYLIDGI